jgi:hypothetical protein
MMVRRLLGPAGGAAVLGALAIFIAPGASAAPAIHQSCWTPLCNESPVAGSVAVPSTPDGCWAPRCV